MDKLALQDMSNLVSNHLTNIDDAQDPTMQGLNEGINRGATGLEYLLGARRKREKTFYDQHPIQAVTRNILNNAPLIGGLGGLTWAGTNLSNDMAQNSRLQQIADSRDPLVNLQDPRFVKAYGEIGPSREKTLQRMNYLRNAGERSTHNTDALEKAHEAYEQAHSAFHAGGGDPEQRLAALESAVTKGKAVFKRPELQVLNGQLENLRARKANFDNAVARLKDVAGTSTATEDLGDIAFMAHAMRPSYKPAVERDQAGKPKTFGKALSPGRGREEFERARLQKTLIRNLELRGNPTFADPAYKTLLKNTAGLHPDEIESITKSIYDQNHWNKLLAGHYLDRLGKPLAIGAAAGVGGMGLGMLLKLLQRGYYGKKKTEDWRRAGLRAAGRFEEAENMQ